MPAHLAKAALPGTYGFDPLRLGTNPETLAWYAEAEKTNGRWAMAAVAGEAVPRPGDPGPGSGIGCHANNGRNAEAAVP